MRFTEFKIINEEEGKFYTIGDSHAVAVAQAGGKNWTNLAIGGRSSTDSAMLANIQKVPKGAVVLVSQGANDTANAMRSHIDSQGKRPLIPAQRIADNVARVVNMVEAQGATVIFLLFPNGPGRGAGLAKYYGGDYQEEVRKAIKSSIGSTKIIDLNGKPLTDGVHATMGAYKSVANQVQSQHGAGVTLGPGNANPGAPATKDKKSGAGTKPSELFPLEVGPPFKVADSKAVGVMQRNLLALGYDVGPTGADGKFGPYTQDALASFQNDYKLEGDGSKYTEAEYNMIRKVVDGKVSKVKPSQDPDDLKQTKAKLNALDPSAARAVGRRYAEKFLGRDLDDDEWDQLLRATYAEASPNTKEQGYVMAVILNRVRSGKYGGNDVTSVLNAKNQFQAVTGTKADGNRPSRMYVQGPQGNSLQSILTAAVKVLPNAPKDIYRFTAADPRAYGPGTNIAYLDKLKKEGGVQIGGTIFA